MSNLRQVPLSVGFCRKAKPWAGALAAMLLCSSAHAITIGHARITSAQGQPLRVDIPLRDIGPDDRQSLTVFPAPASAWAQAGLTPPVDLASIELQVEDGFTPGTQIIRLRSNEVFQRPVVDLLLDVRTVSGNLRYQVSLLAKTTETQAGVAASSSLRGGAPVSGHTGEPLKTIPVRWGDTMFGIGRRHAVPGVTIYQLMIGLQRANPKAFILDNVNLVKAGSDLTVPSKAQLLAISDREARRIFQEHARAFAQYRQRAASVGVPVMELEAAAAAGIVSIDDIPPPDPDAPRFEDRLRLSAGPGNGPSSGGTGQAGDESPDNPNRSTDDTAPSGLTDDELALRKGIEESEERVSQLEENVRTLNRALQAQGAAASGLVIEGAESLGLSLKGSAGKDGEKQAPAPSEQSGGAIQRDATKPDAASGAPTGSAASANGSGAAAVSQQATGQSDEATPPTDRSDSSAANSTIKNDSVSGDSTASERSGQEQADVPTAIGSSGGAQATQRGSEASGAIGGGAAASETASEAADTGARTDLARSMSPTDQATESESDGRRQDGTTTAGFNDPSLANTNENVQSAPGGASESGERSAQTDDSAAAALADRASQSNPSGEGASGTNGGAESAPGSAGSSAANQRTDPSVAGLDSAGADSKTGSSAAGLAATETDDPESKAGARNGLSDSPEASAEERTAGRDVAQAPQVGGDKLNGSSVAPDANRRAQGPETPTHQSSASTGATIPPGAKSPSASSSEESSAVSNVSSKGEQVSWFQEHMLAWGLGLLALLVLIVAWVLRRSQGGLSDGRDDSSGGVTSAMVQEKLDRIDLNLEDDSATRNPER